MILPTCNKNNIYLGKIDKDQFELWFAAKFFHNNGTYSQIHTVKRKFNRAENIISNSTGLIYILIWYIRLHPCCCNTALCAAINQYHIHLL